MHTSSMSNIHQNTHANNIYTKPGNYNTSVESADDLGYGKLVYRKNDLNNPTVSATEQNDHRFEPIQENGDTDKMSSNQSQKQTVGTISGMLADFSRALGLSNTSATAQYADDKGNDNQPFMQELNPSNYQQNLMDHTHGSVWPNESMAQNKTSFYGRNDQYTSIKDQLKQESIYDKLQEQNTQQQQQQQHQHQHQQQQQQQQLEQQQQQIQTHQLQQVQLQQAQLQQAQLQQQQAQIQLELVQQQQHQQHLQQMQHMMLQQQQHVVALQHPRITSEYDEQEQQKQQVVLQTPNTPLQGLLFGQHLTQQQQLMYQQHMQLQHQAQHLKKVKRSLPHSTNDPQKQVQVTKKDTNNWSVVGHTANVQPVTIQQMVAAQLLSQPCLPVQVVASDNKSPHRLIPATSPPNITATTTHQFVTSGVTPMGTPQSTPVSTPRGAKDGGDSSDTMSETDSQKSLRTRRKLPSIPSDQEAVQLPSQKKKERMNRKGPDKFGRPYSPLRQYPDGTYKITSSSNLMLQRPSSSETNLRKVNSYGTDIPRPGSALGLLQGSSVVSSSGICVDYSNRDSEIASCLPPDLRHLLNTYKTSDNTYIGDIKVPISDRRGISRLNQMDWEADRILQRNQELLQNPKNRLDIQRKMVYSGIGRSRKLRAHRRQLSDPKMLLEMSQMKNGSDVQYNRGMYQSLYGSSHPSLCPPYKSFEYESIDGGKLGDWENNQHPYLASYAVAGGALRETAINSVLEKEMHNDSMRYEMRRYSDSLDIGRRGLFKGHRPRSWQPSPYGSDEEDDSLSREQKKAKIKAEIARRRQQIEENARLHEELLRLARLRESAELGYAPLRNNSSLTGDYAMSSVLKSIDDLIGSQQLSDYSNHRTAEDRSMDRIASTFRTDDYTSGVYERLSDFSPITDYSAPHAMPLLPDMPTRSRKLLEDLGSSPITESVLAMQQKGQT
ncbi:hypothetical protein O3M35_003933 [Rhynocoris fuscipes]|uniref:Uncharacterized protein n=1 Tax=Rhynocoris fuscipes TaxID=488301 RepID=A0AAW1CHU1_9HEMI